LPCTSACALLYPHAGNLGGVMKFSYLFSAAFLICVAHSATGDEVASDFLSHLQNLRVQISVPKTSSSSDVFRFSAKGGAFQCKVENVGFSPLADTKDLDQSFQVAWTADDELVNGKHVYHSIYLTNGGEKDLPKPDHVLVSCNGSFQEPGDVVRALTAQNTKISWKPEIVAMNR
jgi:hypothetical protein